MSDLIEQLLEGKLSEDKINFFSYHFQDRLRDNKLDLDYVKNQILHEKPISNHPSKSHEDRYEFLYKAPSKKNYNHIKVILEDCEDHIAVVSVMDHGRDPKYNWHK